VHYNFISSLNHECKQTKTPFFVIFNVRCVSAHGLKIALDMHKGMTFI